MLSAIRSSLSSRRLLVSRLSHSSAVKNGNSAIPWFIDQDTTSRAPPALRHLQAPSLPADTPQFLKDLHGQLLHSPHLDVKHLVVSSALAPPPGPELPERLPQGRRRRGGTYAGESVYDATSGLWSWVVFAQVKEGTEGRGAIDAVVRTVRKVLLNGTPPVTLPPRSKRQMKNGWAMIDAGNFAVHVLSKEAREKYFSDIIPHH